MSFFKDLLENVLPVAYADEGDDTQDEVANSEAPEAEKEDAADEDEDDDDDEDEDDEEESQDPLEKLSEECKNTAACKPFDHHFEECVERVKKEMEEPDYAHKHYKEDCVEEFFHLQHCINDCVAPRLFSKLK
ncbi:QCR6 [Candida oxycetoniae]|uniref:Cytochrome b-c1 complex subunit 6, mitochondrial n=1 Tax=Candida oxycetoniae TaxID=497107 RepID=A0AAI9WYY1_9ASCO|nr:QCR6 [Candida oxycetoniae]KAI3405618.1 QCR6 [Candida oxycetoniae]